jgi:hypothetical protein
MPFGRLGMNGPPTLTLRGQRPIWPPMPSVFMTKAVAKRRRRRSRDTARARAYA